MKQLQNKLYLLLVSQFSMDLNLHIRKAFFHPTNFSMVFLFLSEDGI